MEQTNSQILQPEHRSGTTANFQDIFSSSLKDNHQDPNSKIQIITNNQIPMIQSYSITQTPISSFGYWKLEII